MANEHITDLSTFFEAHDPFLTTRTTFDFSKADCITEVLRFQVFGYVGELYTYEFGAGDSAETLWLLEITNHQEDSLMMENAFYPDSDEVIFRRTYHFDNRQDALDVVSTFCRLAV